MKAIPLFPVLLLLLCQVPRPVAAATSESRHCRVDRTQYDALKVGMPYHRVRSLLKCEGRRISHLTIGHDRRATYSWAGHGTYGANLTLTFHNGHLTDKAQLGLR